MADPRRNKWNLSIKTLWLPLLFICLFYGVAWWRYQATGELFYIYNFGYIGTALALGIFLKSALPKHHGVWGRRIAQFLIGSYLLVYVGFLRQENMQIEGFFFYLMGGVFAGATLHYFIAKIAGPAVFGRGWCGWSCWTAMILDLLPWKTSPGRYGRWGLLRYLHFALSLGLVLVTWFIWRVQDLYQFSVTEMYWLAVGNIWYYGVGIVLSVVLKDNRAFCKYVCPIPVIQRIPTRIALLRMKISEEKCISCKLCEKNCPMDIKLLDYKDNRERIRSAECILCNTCANICPKDAVSMTFKFDPGGTDRLKIRKSS